MIRIYNGGGAYQTNAIILKARFENAGFATQFINEEQIKKDGIPPDTTLLVFGALSVAGFKKALQPEGIKAIQKYVYNGGHYLGICAGGYFGAELIRFQGMDPETKLPYFKNAAGLAFAKVIADGSLTEIAQVHFTGITDSAAIINIQEMDGSPLSRTLYWGGPRFIAKESNGKQSLTVLATHTHTEGEEPFIMGIQSDVGENGGRATLLGYHPEIGKDDLFKLLPHNDDAVLSLYKKRLFEQEEQTINGKDNIDLAFTILLRQLSLNPKNPPQNVGRNKENRLAL